MASREEQLAIERALAYENGVTYMSDRAAGAELDTKVKLHRYAQRQPAQRPAEGDKKRKKRKSKVPPWDRPKKKAVKKYAKVKDGSLTPLAELENKEELAEQDIEGEEDEGNDSDAACPTVVPTGSTNTRRVVQDPGTTFSKTIPQSPISVNSRSSPPPMHLESSSWADTSGSSDSSLPLRPPGGVLPTAAPASLQRAHAYPSPSSNVDADAGPSSSSVIKPNQYWSGGLAAYVPLFASVGIFREEDLWKIAPAAHAERFVCEFLTERTQGSFSADQQWRLVQDIKHYCPPKAGPLGLRPFATFLLSAGIKSVTQIRESVAHARGDVKGYTKFLLQHTRHTFSPAEEWALQIAIEDCLVDRVL